MRKVAGLLRLAAKPNDIRGLYYVCLQLSGEMKRTDDSISGLLARGEGKHNAVKL